MGFYRGPLRTSSRTVARLSPTELVCYSCLALSLSTVIIAATLALRKQHHSSRHHAAEEPTVASPRTPWSSRKNSSRSVDEQIAGWHSWQQVLAAEASQWSGSIGGSGQSLLLLGDSITESWRGTSYGRSVGELKPSAGRIDAHGHRTHLCCHHFVSKSHALQTEQPAYPRCSSRHWLRAGLTHSSLPYPATRPSIYCGGWSTVSFPCGSLATLAYSSG